MRFLFIFCLFSLVLSLSFAQKNEKTNIEELVQHHYANNNGVKIHYVSLGEGPLVVMIHGFPDFWYSWRKQIMVLSPHFRVVAVDLRGYNLSDKPKKVADYKMNLLVSDIVAVIRDCGQEKSVIVGHDWGGAISWQLAITRPEVVERLVICNLPHPQGLSRELAQNEEQQKNSAYARDFQKENAHLALTPEKLSFWVADPEARSKYVEAFQRSSFEGMLNFYKANYPREPYTPLPLLPKVKCSVLMIHGLKDKYLLPSALNDTWQWLEKDLTLVTVPQAGHFVQHDASEVVSKTILQWLMR